MTDKKAEIMQEFKTITEDEVEAWCSLPVFDPKLSRLTDLLNGEYPLDEACYDILSFRKPVQNEFPKA